MLLLTWWLFVILGVLLKLTDVTSCSSSCSNLSHYHLLWWFHVLPGVLQPFTVIALHHFWCLIGANWNAFKSLKAFLVPLKWVALCHPRCQIATHYSGSVLSWLFHCCSWDLFCVIPTDLLLLTEVTLSPSSSLTANHQGCSVFLGVKLMLTKVALRHITCSTANCQCGFVSSQVFYCHSLWSL